jgi:hypothetical protein
MDRHLLGARPRVIQSCKQWLSIIAAWLVAMCLMPAHAQSISTFGKKYENGSTPTPPLMADFKRASRFTLSEPATLREVCVYLDGKGGATGRQGAWFVVYADENGAPGKKVFETYTYYLTDQTAAKWICQNSHYIVPVPAGDYWIGILTSGPGGVLRAFSIGSAQNWYSNADSFGDGPANTFGSASIGSGTLVAYVRYFSTSQVRHAGRTTIGTQVSNGMTANYKRGSRFVMPERGKLYAITAYRDARQITDSYGSPVYQFYSYSIYKDANGVPGAKLWERGGTPTGGGYFWSAPSWDSAVFGSYTGPTLEAGPYWLVIHTDNTAGIMRYYYDYGGNWYGNDDAYVDGASTSFGPGTAKNHTISAFISYRPGTITTGEFGFAEPGTNPSRPLDPDYIRWSTFYLQQPDATLSGLHAYMDGLGSTIGSQEVRMVLYGHDWNYDSNGNEVPFYYKIAESEPVTIAAGMPAQWVDFKVPALPLPSFDYYTIAVQSSGPNAVARLYSDNRRRIPGTWYNRPDAFADGAAESFLEKDPTIGSKPNITLAVYASLSVPFR